MCGHISECGNCRKVRSTTQGQKMADLPTDRLEPSPPFTYSPIDVFGPSYVKERRTELQRCGVPSACMACRGEHTETANSMHTSSLSSACVARRGPVTQWRCDQGTTSVGAKLDLKKCKKETDNDKIRQELMKEQCDCIVLNMNAPSASHMGCLAEAETHSEKCALCYLITLYICLLYVALM